MLILMLIYVSELCHCAVHDSSISDKLEEIVFLELYTFLLLNGQCSVKRLHSFQKSKSVNCPIDCLYLFMLFIRHFDPKL